MVLFLAFSEISTKRTTFSWVSVRSSNRRPDSISDFSKRSLLRLLSLVFALLRPMKWINVSWQPPRDLLSSCLIETSKTNQWGESFSVMGCTMLCVQKQYPEGRSLHTDVVTFSSHYCSLISQFILKGQLHVNAVVPAKYHMQTAAFWQELCENAKILSWYR